MEQVTKPFDRALVGVVLAIGVGIICGLLGELLAIPWWFDALALTYMATSWIATHPEPQTLVKGLEIGRTGEGAQDGSCE